MNNPALYDSIIRDLTDGRIQRLETESSYRAERLPALSTNISFQSPKDWLIDKAARIARDHARREGSSIVSAIVTLEREAIAIFTAELRVFHSDVCILPEALQTAILSGDPAKLSTRERAALVVLQYDAREVANWAASIGYEAFAGEKVQALLFALQGGCGNE